MQEPIRSDPIRHYCTTFFAGNEHGAAGDIDDPLPYHYWWQPTLTRGRHNERVHNQATP